MAINSIARFIIVFPVPVTAFNQTVAKDIRIRAVETIRNTGKADCIKSSPWPYTDKNKCGRIFNAIQVVMASPMLT